MSDFFQNGIVTTLQDFGQRGSAELEGDVDRYARRRPVTLILPCLASELEHAPLDGIVSVLRTVPYVSRIIIGLDRADASAFRKAITYFSRLPQPHQIAWNDGPRIAALLAELRSQGLAPEEQGKGHNLWISLGLLQAEEPGGIVAIHDCDIANYSSRLLARLVYPLVHPDSNYVFAKAYYARVSEGRLYGRVSRLFVTPLLRALKHALAPIRYLDYLDSFRYPLAGECAMHVDVARRLTLTTDWGLEVGVLSEIYRNYSTRQICQVDVADTYDHKHQPLGIETPGVGLNRMTRDIALRIMQGLAAQGQVLDLGHIRTIVTAYERIVGDLIDTYVDVAAINGLKLDRGDEMLAASTFASNLYAAGRHFVGEDYRRTFAPTWDEVVRRQPDTLTRLRSAVALDRAEFGGSC
jgi:glucosyl-3-phosphoglycerate synthase